MVVNPVDKYIPFKVVVFRCVNLHPYIWVASGEVGRVPVVHVWASSDPAGGSLAALRLPTVRGVQVEHISLTPC